MNNKQTSGGASESLTIFKNGIWSAGMVAWLLGILDKSIASFSDSYISATDLIQLLTAVFFSVGWLCLKPAESFNSGGVYD